MRTTLTIEPDVAKKIEQERHRTRRGLKEIINEALRVGLSVSARSTLEVPRFQVRVHHGGFRAGLDPERLNQLLDQFDAERFISQAAEQHSVYRAGVE